MPVHDRHHPIRDDDIGPEGLDLFPTFQAVFGDLDIVAVFLQAFVEDRARMQVVLDDKDARGSRGDFHDLGWEAGFLGL